MLRPWDVTRCDFQDWVPYCTFCTTKAGGLRKKKGKVFSWGLNIDFDPEQRYMNFFAYTFFSGGG